MSQTITLIAHGSIDAQQNTYPKQNKFTLDSSDSFSIIYLRIALRYGCVTKIALAWNKRKHAELVFPRLSSPFLSFVRFLSNQIKTCMSRWFLSLSCVICLLFVSHMAPYSRFSLVNENLDSRFDLISLCYLFCSFSFFLSKNNLLIK